MEWRNRTPLQQNHAGRVQLRDRSRQSALLDHVLDVLGLASHDVEADPRTLCLQNGAEQETPETRVIERTGSTELNYRVFTLTLSEPHSSSRRSRCGTTPVDRTLSMGGSGTADTTEKNAR